MTFKNVQNIAVFSIIATIAFASFGTSNVFAEEDREYKMVGDVVPVLTFTFRDGVEVHSFPVFDMGEKDRKSTRLNSSHSQQSRMPSSA